MTDIGHAFRVTVRATNGYVYPASHRAGSTAGALPMGARLRLKTSVGGLDPALRTTDPNAQKIFRAMQKYGLIVADNGSDLYITGTFDTRWNNDILNPAFATLTASDFEVVQLGWNPAPTGLPSVASFSASPNPVAGGSASTGTVTLTAAAPAGGAAVTLSSASSAVTVPASATVAQGANAVTFAIATAVVAQTTAATLTASYNGTNATTTFTVNPALPPTLTKLTLNPTTVSGGNPSIGTVTLAAPAPAGGALVTLKSSNPAAAAVPPSVLVAAGATTQTFTVTTAVLKRSAAPVISATYAGVKKTATLTIKRG